jgi:hypothetical protein
MKKLICAILSVSMLLSSSAFADCQWARDIKKVEGGYLYTNDCHGQVGVIVKDNDDLKTEVVNLRKGLELKDLVVQKSDERVMLWRNESYEQFDRLQKQTEAAHRNETLWFVLGIVVTGAAVWGAGQLR